MHRTLLLCIRIIKYKKKKLNCLSDKFLFSVYNTKFVCYSKWDEKKECVLRNISYLFYSIWADWWLDSLLIEVKSFLNIDVTSFNIFFDLGPPKTKRSWCLDISINYFLRSIYRRAINLSNSSSNITGKEIFITANHSSNESGHIWNTV
jgi:hypothetical protein